MAVRRMREMKTKEYIRHSEKLRILNNNESNSSITAVVSSIGIKANNHVIGENAFNDLLNSGSDSRILMYYNHNSDNLPLGHWQNFRMQGDKLVADGYFSDTDNARDAKKLLNENVLDSVSMGGYATDFKYNEDDNSITLNTIELDEVSIVHKPAYEDAKIIDIRNSLKEEYLKMSKEKTVEPTVDVNAVVDEKVNHAKEDLTKQIKDVGLKVENTITKEDLNKVLLEHKEDVSGMITEKIEALPVKQGSEKPKSGEFVKMSLNGASFMGTKIPILHSYLDNTDVAGGRVSAQSPFYHQYMGNIMGRQLATIFSSGGQGVVKLPEVSNINFAPEPMQLDTGRTRGGTLASKQVVLETFVSENAFSLSSLDYVPSLDASIVSLMQRRALFREGQDAVAVIKADSTIESVATGEAAALGTAAETLEQLRSMITSLDSAYLAGAVFCISRAVWGLISGVTTANSIVFDQARGVNTFLGYPLIIIDQLEVSTTGGNLVGVFGQFSSGFALMTGSELTIGRYEQTTPGSMTYFGMFQAKHSVWDDEALVKLVVGA